MALDPITGAETLIDDALNKFIADPAQKAAATAQVMGILTTQMQTQASVIIAEANSANKLASSWRPMLMYTFMLIIFNNYFFAPYLQALFGVGLSLALPPDMWSLLKICVGGYVVGRTGEKMMTPHPVTGVSPVQSVINTFKGH